MIAVRIGTIKELSRVAIGLAATSEIVAPIMRDPDLLRTCDQTFGTMRASYW